MTPTETLGGVVHVQSACRRTTNSSASGAAAGARHWCLGTRLHPKIQLPTYTHTHKLVFPPCDAAPLPGWVSLVLVQVVYEVNSLPGHLESWSATVQRDVLEPLKKAQEDWGSPNTKLLPAGQQVCAPLRYMLHRHAADCTWSAACTVLACCAELQYLQPFPGQGRLSVAPAAMLLASVESSSPQPVLACKKQQQEARRSTSHCPCNEDPARQRMHQMGTAAVAVFQGFGAVVKAAEAWTKLLSYQLRRLGPVHLFEFDPDNVPDELVNA